ncbi:MAG: RluA family pseudouridine synthase [Clostridia bacterium]|nr:RluA family pseudouridine synthase [Clostridia bacterium]
MVEYIVNENENGTRLDAFVASKDEKFSRSLVQKLIKDSKILVDGKSAKPSEKVQAGERICVDYREEPNDSIKGEEIPIDIIYEDDDILVVNKPKNMVVHPAAGNRSGTLVNALLGRHELSSMNGDIRPGIVHRLDKNTTGVLVIAKNNFAHQKIAKQIQNRETKKEYIALVRGLIKENEGVINMPIGRHPTDRKKMAVTREGKEAITEFKVLKRFSEGYTLLKINLKTGRTHQIRVHLSHIGYPIVGDDTYSTGKNPFGVTSQMLHAHKLSFVHPTSGEKVEFEAPIPEYFEEIVENLTEI